MHTRMQHPSPTRCCLLYYPAGRKPSVQRQPSQSEAVAAQPMKRLYFELSASSNRLFGYCSPSQCPLFPYKLKFPYPDLLVCLDLP